MTPRGRLIAAIAADVLALPADGFRRVATVVIDNTVLDAPRLVRPAGG